MLFFRKHFLSDKITTIDDYVFASCPSLKTICMSNKITSIKTYAFDSAYSLKNISLNDSITSIGNYAFRRCYSLENVLIPKAITSILKDTFELCYSLAQIIVRNNLTSIQSYAFRECHGIKIYDFSEVSSIPSLSNTDAFYYMNKICKVIVPDALYDNWIAATNWSTYANYIYKASEVA